MPQESQSAASTSGDTEMADVSRATYVKMPADRPIGLDMKDFEQDNQ